VAVRDLAVRQDRSRASNLAVMSAGTDFAPTDPPQRSRTERPLKALHLLRSRLQRRSHRPPHLWGQRPKILCRLCKPWSNQCTASVGSRPVTHSIDHASDNRTFVRNAAS
jgi:hypothetical protein